MHDAQLIELQEGAHDHQKYAPFPALSIDEMADAHKYQKHGPKLPEAVEGNDPQVVEKQSEADQSQHRARDQAPAKRPDGSGFQACVDIAMDPVAQVFAELVRIGFILVAHQRSPIAEEPAQVSYPAYCFKKTIPH